jgi:RHS repeat-associated protein
VEKNVGGAYTEIEYDASGEPIAENNRASWTSGFVPLGNRHVAHIQNGATYFVHTDQLGSTGQVTDYSGTVAQDQLFYPFGQNWLTLGTSQEMRFASLRHRDSETTLDPTQFRMFSSNQGRWLSPDPIPGQTCSPQTFNRYAYVSGSPTNKIDPKGLLIYFPPPGDCGPLGSCDCDPVFGCWPYALYYQLRIRPLRCLGTTSCAYYDTQCKDPFVVQKTYYCSIAPSVCNSPITGTGPIGNCIRLCLQIADTCSRIASYTDFTACQTLLHITCASYCGLTCH